MGINRTSPPSQDEIDVQRGNLKSLGMGYSSACVEVIPLDNLRKIEEGEKDPVYEQEYRDRKSLPPPAVVKAGCHYDVMDGNRRMVSARSAGLKEMHVIVMEGFQLGSTPTTKPQQPDIAASR